MSKGAEGMTGAYECTFAVVLALTILVVLAGCDVDRAFTPDEEAHAGVHVADAGAVNGGDVGKAFAFTEWTSAVSIEAGVPGAHPNFNTTHLEGCANISRDGNRLYMASNRPGGLGGIDIWFSSRASADEPWGEPINAGAPVNSAADDFCPTLTRDGHKFFFVSNRPGGCGGPDIYVTRRGPHGWAEPSNLGCDVNSAAGEASPFLALEPGSGPVLYFSSTRPGGFEPEAEGATSGDSDIYKSEWRGGDFGSPELVPGVNSAFDDGHPNVRRDALEMFLFSTRPGTIGASDIYSTTRARTEDAWSTPVNLGPGVNSPDGESRPSLSWDGTTLYFGSSRPDAEGSSDFFVTTRAKLN